MLNSATAIPMATLTWWYNGLQLGLQDLDRNFMISGLRKLSVLRVTPLSSKYYGNYTCKAENSHGVSFQTIVLKEATVPSVIPEIIVDKITATTLLFLITPPESNGGMPIEEYVIEYKLEKQSWDQSIHKMWRQSDRKFSLDNLSPETSYNLKFCSKNKVGHSKWTEPQKVTLLKRGKPEIPHLDLTIFPLEKNAETRILNLNQTEQLKLSWDAPNDNGFPIDFFILKHQQVAFNNSFTSNILSRKSLEHI